MSSWNKHAFVDMNAKMSKRKRVQFNESRPFRVCDYFDSLEQRGGGRGELSKHSEGISEQTPYSCAVGIEIGLFTASTLVGHGPTSACETGGHVASLYQVLSCTVMQ